MIGITKCGWCGVRIYPWTRNIVKTMFGYRHIVCHIDFNRKVGHMADWVDDGWEKTA